MSALWSGWGSDPFTELVEKATSELLPAGQEDIALNLEICDQVRAKQVQAKQAMQVLKRRISHKNPNVVLLALGLTDICIKNGGDHFLQEVASREFMDNLVSVLKNPSGVNHDVKTKALGLIQSWAQIADAKPAQMSHINQVYRTLKSERFEFPPLDPKLVASAALVETLTAPEWVDGEVCMRCRTGFTTFNRKHHCRNCGNVFCQQCSSHTMALPWFGIGQDVRVCDGCHTRKAPPKNAAKLSRSKSTTGTSSSSSFTTSGRGGAGNHHRSATLGSGRHSKRSTTQEDDDLALAIKLSLESAGQSGASASSARGEASTPSQPSATKRATRQPDGRMLEGTDADDDPDLAAAIAASLRDWAPPQPSAPDGLSEGPSSAPQSTHSGYPTTMETPKENLNLPPSLELPPADVDAILTFSQTVQAQELYNQRNGITGGPPHQQAQALYEKATGARPKMVRSLEEGRRRHGVLTSMHDKLSEAVKLYDRLLDAQMNRPVQTAGYTYDYDHRMAPFAAQHQHLHANQPQSGLYPHVQGHQMGYHHNPVDMSAYAAHPGGAATPTPHGYAQHSTPHPNHPTGPSSASHPSYHDPYAQANPGIVSNPASTAAPPAVSAVASPNGSAHPSHAAGLYPSVPYQPAVSAAPETYSAAAPYRHPAAAAAVGHGAMSGQTHGEYAYGGVARTPSGAYPSGGYMDAQMGGPTGQQTYYVDAASGQHGPMVSSPGGDARYAQASVPVHGHSQQAHAHQHQHGQDNSSQVHQHQHQHQQQDEQQQLEAAAHYAQVAPSAPGGETQSLQQAQADGMGGPGPQINVAAPYGSSNGIVAHGSERRRSTDTLASSQNGWNTVPIESISPAGVSSNGNYRYDHQGAEGAGKSAVSSGPSAPGSSPTASRPMHNAQVDGGKADNSRLPLFPIAPHADNALAPIGGGVHEVASPLSAHTNGGSSTGMWQQSPVKAEVPSQQAVAAGESPLIEF